MCQIQASQNVGYMKNHVVLQHTTTIAVAVILCNIYIYKYMYNYIYIQRESIQMYKLQTKMSYLHGTKVMDKLTYCCMNDYAGV